MIEYIVKRVFMLIPVVLGTTLLVFFIMNMASGDPVLLILGENANAEARAAMTAELGLDKPLLVKYGNYLLNLLKGDMGYSYMSGASVFREITAKFPNTLKLALVSAVFSIMIGIPLGIIAALKQNTVFDNVSMVFSLFGNAMPSFWLAIMLILLFALKLNWLPPGGMNAGWKSYVLPAVSIGLVNMAAIARTSRSTMLETIRADYVRTAKSKGIQKSRVIMAHAFRNSLVPILTVIGVQFGNLLGGAVVVETVFAWNGLGRLMVQSVTQRDTPLVLGCVISLSICYSVANLIVDLLYCAVDPRVKSAY